LNFDARLIASYNFEIVVAKGKLHKWSYCLMESP